MPSNSSANPEQSLLKNWRQHDFETLEKGVLVAEHTLLDTGLFTDEGLIKILDRHPDEALSLSTMGEDSNTFEWRDGDRNGVSGEVLLETLQRGHLWINCREMHLHQPEVAEVINRVYDELERSSPGFVAQDRTANLLISSPSAIVHYHVDMPVNMLWHLRGRKRVWVYPPFDHRFAELPILERVCIGEWSEEVPYCSEWDRYALQFDAEPGQLITWPQLTPHRVTNLEGLNVSLSTEHKNPLARRRLNVHRANHLLRQNLGWNPKSASPYGCVGHCKQTLARIDRYWKRLMAKPEKQFVYPKTFVIDPEMPKGYRLLNDRQEVVAPHMEYELTEV